MNIWYFIIVLPLIYSKGELTPQKLNYNQYYKILTIITSKLLLITFLYMVFSAGFKDSLLMFNLNFHDWLIGEGNDIISALSSNQHIPYQKYLRNIVIKYFIKNKYHILSVSDLICWLMHLPLLVEAGDFPFCCRSFYTFLAFSAYRILHLLKCVASYLSAVYVGWPLNNKTYILL